MRIVEIEIEDLFGTFHHRIPLNTDDRITIIHGPNGFGKTILLEMVHGLFHGRYAKLRRIPFGKLAVRLDDGKRIVVRKEAIAAAIPPPKPRPPAPAQNAGRRPRPRPSDLLSEWIPAHTIKLALQNGDSQKGIQHEEFVLPLLPLPLLTEDATHYLESLGLGRIDQHMWFDPVSHKELSLDDVLEVYSPEFPFNAILRFPPLTRKEEQQWWAELRKCVCVEMIREQRLTTMGGQRDSGRQRETRLAPAVREYSGELAAILQSKLAESVEHSQSLDRTFPVRLLKRINEKGPTELELTARLADLERKRKQLRDAGLLDEQQDMPPLLTTEGLGDTTLDVLAVYVEDAEKKLGIFDDLARKIKLFQEIVNSRFLYKRLHISREDGFVFTTSTGEPLPLSALSSGEQQEIVLMYELLFRVKEDSLVLIDEPEISLHVAWQKRFLEDLTRITELASFDVLIATHSPQIIHKRWDLTVELESPGAEAELETVSLP